VKLLLIGAGIRTPLLITGLIRRQDALGLREVVLYDSDAARLATMGAFVRHIEQARGARFRIAAAHDLAEAAAGASFIFSAIRVGQERNRIADERVPLKHGVLGQETTGPGGFAMALRTIPVLLDYARTIARVAPDAWFVNFTNPAGLITQALLGHTDLRVIGICDTPTSMQASLAHFLGRPADAVFVEYAGLNHLGWVRRVLVDGRDRLPEILRDYEALRAQSHEWALFDPALVRLYGLLPNEYLYYYYYRERAVAHILESGSTRGEQILGINEPLWQELHEALGAGQPERALAAYERRMLARSATYMARESGHALEPSSAATESVFAGEGYAGMAMAVMTAIGQRRKTTLILNVANRAALPDLAPDDVVEVPCLVDENGAVPLAQTPLPVSVRPLVHAVKAYERLTVEAAVTGSYDAALQALTIHPLVASYSLAKQILDEYLDVHAAYLPQFGQRGGAAVRA